MQMANITVKKADGTTDIVFTALTPSAGDNIPAVWRNENAALPAGGRPVASLLTKWNGPRTARRSEFSFSYPVTYTDTTTTLTKVAHKIPFTVSCVVPQEVPDATIAEAVHQASNLLVSVLMRDSIKSGYSPT